jgi:hypothetical protein
MEELPKKPNIETVETDSWVHIPGGSDAEIIARVDPCVIVVVHAPGQGTFFGHFSTPEVSVPDRENQLLPQDLAGMVDVIKQGAAKGKFSLSGAKVYIVGGATSSEEDAKYNTEVDRGFSHAVEVITALGFGPHQMHVEQFARDAQYYVSINNQTGDLIIEPAQPETT